MSRPARSGIRRRDSSAISYCAASRSTRTSCFSIAMDNAHQIEKPDDADAGVWREWLLIQLRTNWTVNGRTYSAGALLACKLDAFLAGGRDLDQLFTPPTDRRHSRATPTTRHAILVNELDNVRNRIYVLRYENGKWSRAPFAGLPENGHQRLRRGRSHLRRLLGDRDGLPDTTQSSCSARGGCPAGTAQQSPKFFDGDRDVVTQHEAVSKDGTYFPTEVRLKSPARRHGADAAHGVRRLRDLGAALLQRHPGQRLDRARRRARAREHPRRRRIRPALASGGCEGESAARVRGLHCRGGGPDSPPCHRLTPPGVQRAIEWRPARRQHADTAARSVRRDRLRLAAARHAALSQAARGRLVDGRVRRPRGSKQWDYIRGFRPTRT